MSKKQKKQKAATNNANTSGKPKATRRSKSATLRKTTRRKPGSAAPKPKSPELAAPSSMEPTPEEIRLRAYFIAERRHRLDLPGDADSDWLEAKNQLLSELSPR